jgi:hypothetical protein
MLHYYVRSYTIGVTIWGVIKMTCLKCGFSELPEGSLFCNKCGAKIEIAQEIKLESNVLVNSSIEGARNVFTCTELETDIKQNLEIKKSNKLVCTSITNSKIFITCEKCDTDFIIDRDNMIQEQSDTCIFIKPVECYVCHNSSKLIYKNDTQKKVLEDKHNSNSNLPKSEAYVDNNEHGKSVPDNKLTHNYYNELDYYKESNRKNIIIIAIIIVVIIGIAFLFAQCSSNNSDSSINNYNNPTLSSSSDNTTLPDTNDSTDSENSNPALVSTPSADGTISEQQPDLLVDSNGKKLWKCYYYEPYIHFSENYNGTGNFIIEILDSNQDLYSVVVNEIGSFDLDKTVEVPPSGDYYIEETITDGSTTGNFNPSNYDN